MRKSQTGIALITVLLVLSLATVAAVSMTSRQQLDIRRTTNILKIEEGYVALLAAEEFARRLLLWDFRQIPNINDQINTITDGYGDLWRSSFLDTAKQTIGNFEVINFKIVDLQGRFNLNNLVDANQNPSGDDVAAFRRLLSEKGLPAELADVSTDWIDTGSVRYQTGAEDNAYQTLSKPYLTPNRFMASASELNRVMGVNLAGAEDYNRVNKNRREIIRDLLYENNDPALTALPVRTNVNVNTAASPAIFQLLVPNLESDDADTLYGLTTQVGDGGDPPFENVNDFWAEVTRVSQLNIPQNQRMPIAVSSEYFLFSAEAISGDLVVYSHTIFHRTNNPQSVEVVHRSYGKKGEI